MSLSAMFWLEFLSNMQKSKSSMDNGYYFILEIVNLLDLQNLQKKQQWNFLLWGRHTYGTGPVSNKHLLLLGL